MKKTTYLFLVFLTQAILNNSLSAQAPYNLKEQYDHFNFSYPYEPYTGGYTTDIELAKNLGDGMSYMLESYLKMYEATGDKAYLYKFINHTVKIQSMRGSFPSTGGAHYGPDSWSAHPMFYHNGLILWPMAHFVHLVLMDQPDLQIVPLSTVCLNDPTTLSTMGDFAYWLQGRVQESMDDFITHHWGGSSKGFIQAVDTVTNASMEINKEAAFGSTCFYIGHTLPAPNLYLTISALIAALYKTNVFIEDHCIGFPCSLLTYNDLLLKLNTSQNSYSWYSEGWRISYRGCGCSLVYQPDYPQYQSAMEDISHASLVLTFPLIAYKYGLNNGGTPYFTNTEMTRFRNMFAKNVWKGSSDPYSFYNSVTGSDYGISEHSGVANAYDMMALTYMQLEKFDEYDSDPETVYDIIMNFYKHKIIDGNPANMSQGNYFTGLADMVSAQWQKECVNLTLYNRDLVYDQDFTIRNILSIAPEQIDDMHTSLTADSYADPVISSAEFIIEDQVVSNMTAGEEIVFKPGFTAKTGCSLTASINTSACTDGRSMALTEPGSYVNAMIPEEITGQPVSTEAPPELNKQVWDVEIFPNPGKGVYTIQLKDETQIPKDALVTVYNFMGTIMLQKQLLDINETIDITGKAKGFYYVKLESGNEVKMRKIIYE